MRRTWLKKDAKAKIKGKDWKREVGVVTLKKVKSTKEKDIKDHARIFSATCLFNQKSNSFANSLIVISTAFIQYLPPNIRRRSLGSAIVQIGECAAS